MRTHRGTLLRLLSGGVATQIVTSATSLIVSLVLIRRTSSEEYGYYVLMTTAVVLFTTLQGAFIQPPTVIRLTSSDRNARANLTGALQREQRRFAPAIALAAVLLATVLELTGRLNARGTLLLIAAAVALITALRREFYRLMLFAHRLPGPVLKADSLYCVLLIGTTALATLTPAPAVGAAVAMSSCAMVGSYLLGRALWRYEPWNPQAPGGAMRELFQQGSWSALGAGARFLFSQGYSYLVAANLSVVDVAMLAATRLPVSPVALLSNGVGPLMLPTVSDWNSRHYAGAVLRRVAFVALGISALACVYLTILWLVRDGVFVHVLHKSFIQQDTLLLLWSVSALVSACRDPFMYFLTARGRFRRTTSMTVVSAIVSLTMSVFAMRRFGPVGAPLGVLTGELLNLIGTAVAAILEARRQGRSVSLAV